MAIRIFVFSLLIISIIGYFATIENSNKKNLEQDTPLLTFSNSAMYTLTPQNMNRVIYSKRTSRYKDRDIMYEGVLTLKNKDKNQKEVTDFLYADVIIKKDSLFKFIGNTRYKRDDYIKFNTNELMYDSKTQIATNSLPFNGYYFNDYIKGTNLYLDIKKHYMKSKNTHFEIDITNN